MGAGKTSIGRALATLLGWSFVDLDQEIEFKQKATIREIFQLHGEIQFREIETEALQRDARTSFCADGDCARRRHIYPACNVDLLRNSGARVVFLETPIERDARRCCDRKPILRGESAAAGCRSRCFSRTVCSAASSLSHCRSDRQHPNRTAEENAREIASKLQLAIGAR